jgi:predicted nucleic-acid-binding protein
MKGLDTNVLVRYLAQDDPAQSERATRLIETELSAAEPGFISAVVLVELCWVLKRLYAATPQELVDTVADLLAGAQFHVDQRDAVQATVRHLRESSGSTVDLPDVLIAQIARSHGCTETVTFDRKAARGAGMSLLAV